MSEYPHAHSQDLERGRPGFEYSPENPPPLEALESKLFAVHVTQVLPKDGVMIAGAQDISRAEPLAQEPPSFRPTLHFCLGEVMQQHGQFSWDEKPYAVVLPLKALKDQLVNVYPNDTFVLGNYHLTEEATLLVPHGTIADDIPDTVPIVAYDPEAGLRAAVDNLIEQKQGWPVRMQPGGVDIGSMASIYGVSINDPKFFSALYEDKPHLSYGTHCTSERGEAFRFGSIEQAIERLIKGYDPYGSPFQTSELRFYRAYIAHNQARLSQFLHAQDVPPESLHVFEQKLAKLQGWLNIVDVDIELRQKSGKTLNRADQPIIDLVTANRHTIGYLRQIAQDQHNQLPAVSDENHLPGPGTIAETLVGFRPDEVQEFIAKNQDIFKDIDTPALLAHYATARWVLDTSQAACEQGLDTMLEQALGQVEPHKGAVWEEPIFETLDIYLSEGSNRLDMALHILRQPYVHTYLQRVYGMDFPQGEPQNLESVLRTHPDTQVLFDPPELQLTHDGLMAYNFLEAIEQVLEPITDPADALSSFKLAYHTAWEIKGVHNILVDDIEVMQLPMNSVRNPANSSMRGVRNFYKSLRDNEQPIDVWRHLGVEGAYRQHFPRDRHFWRSDQSLLEIYRMLLDEEGL